MNIPSSRLASLLTQIGLASFDWRRSVAACALALLVIAAALGLPPAIDTAPTALLPEDEPHAAALADMRGELGATGALTLVFDEEADLDALSNTLEQLDSVAAAFAGLPDEAAVHLALMRLDPEAVGRFTERVRMALSLGPTLNPVLAARLLNADELTAPLESTGPSLLPDDGFRRILLLPTEPAFDAPFSEKLVRDVRAVVSESPQEPHFVYAGGPYVTVADGTASVRSDLVATSGISALLVLVVLVVGTRSFRAPVVLFPPLVLANVLLLAILGGVFGALNTFTSLGTAVLIGLGIDFGVHLLGRVREEKAAGRSPREAVGIAWGTAGPPCVFAAFTSTAGFLAASVGEFRGLSELGVALGVGLMLSLASMMVLLPGLIAWLDRSDRPLFSVSSESSESTATSRRGLQVALAAIAVATVLIGAWGADALTFEYDFTKTGRLDAQHDRLDPETRALLLQALPPVVVTLDDASAAHAFATHTRQVLERGDLPHVRGVVDVGTLLPSDQRARVEALAALRDELERPEARHLPQGLLERLAPLHEWSPEERTLRSLSPALDGLLVQGKRVMLIPQGDLHDMRETAKLVHEVDGLGEIGTSVHLLQGVVYESVTGDAPKVVALAFVVVLLLVLFDLRRPAPVALAVFSLVAGMAWAVGAIAAADIRVGLGNLIGFPILLGIGVDVVIHLAHRLQHDPIPMVLRTAGVSALLSTLTTIASFVALNMASSGAIRTLGQLVALGLATVAVVSAGTLILGWAATATKPPEILRS